MNQIYENRASLIIKSFILMAQAYQHVVKMLIIFYLSIVHNVQFRSLFFGANIQKTNYFIILYIYIYIQITKIL